MKKRDGRLVQNLFCYYQNNRLVDFSYHQFFGTYISDRWCHITFFWEFSSFFPSIFRQLDKKKFAENFFAGVSDNLKKMKKKFRKKIFRKNFEFFFIFFKLSETSAKKFSANFFFLSKKNTKKKFRKLKFSYEKQVWLNYVILLHRRPQEMLNLVD